MAVKARVSGGWINAANVRVRVSGAWVNAKAVHARVGGAWVKVWPIGPSVTAPTANITRDTDATTVYAGIEFRNNGTLWENATSGSTSFSLVRTNWLSSGTASQVWIERVISSGSLNWLDAGAGRLVLSTSRFYGTSDSTTFGGAVTCSLTFNFYDAASGGNLLGTSGLITISANRGFPE